MAAMEMPPPNARRIIVGLGNPGPRYADTRHNVGFGVIDVLRRKLGATPPRELCGSLVAEAGAFWLVAPQTYMNRSGYAVRCLLDHQAAAPDQVLVVYDEIHLPLGQLRLRGKGSAAGHRGMESILESVGSSEIPRLRLGVGGVDGPPAGEGLADFVLAPFAAAERAAVDAMLERAAEGCLAWAELGLETAMSRFNSAKLIENEAVR